MRRGSEMNKTGYSNNIRRRIRLMEAVKKCFLAVLLCCALLMGTVFAFAEFVPQANAAGDADQTLGNSYENGSESDVYDQAASDQEYSSNGEVRSGNEMYSDDGNGSANGASSGDGTDSDNDNGSSSGEAFSSDDGAASGGDALAEDAYDTEDGFDADSAENDQAGSDEGSFFDDLFMSIADSDDPVLKEVNLIRAGYFSSWYDRWGNYPKDGTDKNDYVYYLWQLQAKVKGATEKYALVYDMGTLSGSSSDEYGIIQGGTNDQIMGWKIGTSKDIFGKGINSKGSCEFIMEEPDKKGDVRSLFVLTRFPVKRVPVTGLDIKTKGKVYLKTFEGNKKRNISSGTSSSSAKCVCNKYLTSSYSGPSGVTVAKSGTTVTFKWKKDAKPDGYILEYSRNRLFTSCGKIKLGRYAASKKLKKMAKTGSYYARIKSFKTIGGKTYYSRYSLSSNARKTVTLKTKIRKTGGKVFELRSQAGQKMFAYDTVQGGCTDGKYAYYILYDRTKENCKVAKVRLKDMKVKKVSLPIGARHGNGVTYNKRNKTLCVTHTYLDNTKVTIVDASSLKVKSRKNIKVSKSIKGITKTQKRAGFRFGSISYNYSRNKYVVHLSGTANFLILSGKLEPEKIIRPSSRSYQVRQCVDATGKYIMVLSSPYRRGQTNMIEVYDWSGNYLSKMVIPGGYETENIFLAGSKLYVTSYRSYYKPYKKKITAYKKVRIKGSSKYRKVAYKKTVTKYKLKRDNYTYRLKGV